MNTKPSLATLPSQRSDEARKKEHHPWDRAWKRALDERTTEILAAMCQIDTTGAKVDRGPDEHERDPRQLRTDRVYVAEYDSGNSDVIHFEVQVDPDKGFNRRLVGYWSQLDRLYPDRSTHELRQFVFLPTGAAGITGEYRRGGMSLNYRVIDIPKIPAQELLDGPLPTLAFWSSPDPLQLIDQVVDRIDAIPGLDARAAVTDLGMLAEERVASRFTQALRSRNMKNVLENTDFGRELSAQKLAEGRASVMTELVEEKFGPGSTTQALLDSLSRLAVPRAIALITSSATFEELTAAL